MADTHFDLSDRQRMVALDPEALGQLFDAFFEPLWSFIRRSVHDDGLSEDLAQDVFLRVYKALPRFDATKPLRPWIYTIATNRMRDYFRSSGKRQGDLSIDVEEHEIELQSDAESANDVLEREELAGVIAEAVTRLPERTRLVVQLRAYHELSFEEIGDILSLKPAAARKRYSRALAALREELADHPEVEV